MPFVGSFFSAAQSHRKSMAFSVRLNSCDPWTSVPSTSVPSQKGSWRWWLQCGQVPIPFWVLAELNHSSPWVTLPTVLKPCSGGAVGPQPAACFSAYHLEAGGSYFPAPTQEVASKLWPSVPNFVPEPICKCFVCLLELGSPDHSHHRNIIFQRANENTALMCFFWRSDAIACEVLSWKPHYHSNWGPSGIWCCQLPSLLAGM